MEEFASKLPIISTIAIVGSLYDIFTILTSSFSYKIPKSFVLNLYRCQTTHIQGSFRPVGNLLIQYIVLVWHEKLSCSIGVPKMMKHEFVNRALLSSENGVVQFPISEEDNSLQPIKETSLKLPLILDYLSSLLHLSFFGILGVLTRYLLKKLFGRIARRTNDILHPDLASNMVGSLLMGWWGVVFKEDIASVSDHLAVGLTSGYLGSLTTFSGWNQTMLDLVVNGRWVDALVGYLVGMFIVAYSIHFGIGTANCFKLTTKTSLNWRVDGYRHRLAVIGVLVLMVGCLLSISGTLLKQEINSGSNSGSPELWLACLVAAPGVWIRWFLARINGRGLGNAGHIKWMPFGTLIANVSACCISAALSTLKETVEDKSHNWILTGIQLGFPGCLSTVSAFISEYNAMERRNEDQRAYTYALTTIAISIVLGILVYVVPV